MTQRNMTKPRSKYFPRTLIKLKKNITEIPYGFLDIFPSNSNLSFKNTNKKFFTRDNSKSFTHSFSPDPYIISFKSEIQKALNNIKKLEIPIETKEPERKIDIRYKNRDEIAIKSFVEAIFSNEISLYKKSPTENNRGTDIISAERILIETKKIIKYGAKKKISNQLGDKIEDFWRSYISKEKVIRWDTFEDSFYSYISRYMVLDFGIIRKINWRLFFQKLFLNLSKENLNFGVWMSCPSFSLIPTITHRTVSFKDFSESIISQEMVKTLHSCVGEVSVNSMKPKEDIYLYSCGCKYKGQRVDGKREGTGSLSLCSKETYYGIFLDGLYNDFGTLEFCGLLYKGYFKKDSLHGFGKILYPNNSYFEGVFKKGGMRNGCLKWPDGKFYQGEFTNGLFEGKGKLVTPLEELYEGMWKDGNLHGQGVIIDKTGCKLKGVFIDGLLTNKGKLVCDEYTYKGLFLDSKPHGKGKFVFKSGILYKGEVNNGKIDGFGLMTYPSGETYEGFFINSEQIGIGKIKYIDGKVYEGQVYSGKPSGNGIYVFPQGSFLNKYEGEVKDGELHGNGEGWFGDQSYYKGQWSNGNIQGSGIWIKDNIKYDGDVSKGTFHGFGKLFIGNSYYIGYWCYGKPHGKGEIKDNNETIYSGVFEDGIPIGKNKIDKNFLNFISTIELFYNKT